MRYRLKMLSPYHLGLCELVDRRLDKSGRRLALPNGLLQTLDHMGLRVTSPHRSQTSAGTWSTRIKRSAIEQSDVTAAER